MKLLFRFLCFSAVLFLLFSVSASAVQNKSNGENYLIVGFDDAAQNTDVIFILTLDYQNNTSTIVQIPRDTYFYSGKEQNRINRVYADFLNSGLSSKAAMKKTCELYASSLGINIDGFMAITTEAFVSVVDIIGGISINLAEEFTLRDSSGNIVCHLIKGENLISGEVAKTFVRYRENYAMGDLGRLDAQKIFINGFYKTVTENVSNLDLIKAGFSMLDGIVTDFSLADVIAAVVKRSSKFRDPDIYYMTMPGEPILDNGVWYYILNKEAAKELSIRFLFADGNHFDNEERFRNKSNTEAERIYLSSDFHYKVYKKDEVEDIIIKKRQ